MYISVILDVLFNFIFSPVSGILIFHRLLFFFPIVIFFIKFLMLNKYIISYENHLAFGFQNGLNMSYHVLNY